MKNQQVKILTDVSLIDKALSKHLTDHGYDRLIIVVDENTERHCLSKLTDGGSSTQLCATTPIVVVSSGEKCKGIDTVKELWLQLLSLGANRRTCLCALGGGALTDMVGFVAATYMRGIGLVHLPTTILGAVDASIGGKTAIDLDGIKNIVGAFYPASLVLVCPEFFDTLPRAEWLSGYGEILKYGLLSGHELYAKTIGSPIGDLPSDLLEACVEHKMKVVAEDPLDQGIRMTLNLGHTVAHALEGLMLRNDHSPLPHGVAVVAGLVVDLYLSVKRCGFDRHKMYAFVQYAKEEFPAISFSCHDYPQLIELMKQDKKNSGNHLTTILLKDIGHPQVIRDIETLEMEEALDFYRDFMGV